MVATICCGVATDGVYVQLSSYVKLLLPVRMDDTFDCTVAP